MVVMQWLINPGIATGAISAMTDALRRA